MRHAFILGRHPELSVAELGAFFGDKVEYAANKPFAFYGGAIAKNFLDRLGGTTAILEIFEQNLTLPEVQNAIDKFLKKRAIERTGKLDFAINEIPEKRNSAFLRLILPRAKKSLRAAGISAGFMNKDFANVSDVFAFKQGLHKKGTLVNILDIGEGKVALGFTAAMQDFEAYSKRDYGKPFRDAASGMLPPKLAQIMVNLACGERAPGQNVVADPFCGSGTVLMEAMLMGYSVIGSDADGRMADGAEKNIEWLRKNFPIAADAQSNIFQKDARKISSNDWSIAPDVAIVTEPSLGPALSTLPAASFMEKIMTDLEVLYMDFFRNLARVASIGTPLVFIFPYYRQKNGAKARTSACVDKIESLGYSGTTFDPLKTTSLFYERPDQIVGREIVRFRKK